jgi:hypothetical protein
MLRAVRVRSRISSAISPAAGCRVSHSTCRHRNRASAGRSRAGGPSRRSSATRPAQDARTVRMAARVSAATGFIEWLVALFVGTFRITCTTFGLAPLLQSEYSAGRFNRLFTRRSRHAIQRNPPPPALPGPSPALPFRALRHDAARHRPRLAKIPPLEHLAYTDGAGRFLGTERVKAAALAQWVVGYHGDGTAGEPTQPITMPPSGAEARRSLQIRFGHTPYCRSSRLISAWC